MTEAILIVVTVAVVAVIATIWAHKHADTLDHVSEKVDEVKAAAEKAVK